MHVLVPSQCSDISKVSTWQVDGFTLVEMVDECLIRLCLMV